MAGSTFVSTIANIMYNIYADKSDSPPSSSNNNWRLKVNAVTASAETTCNVYVDFVFTYPYASCRHLPLIICHTNHFPFILTQSMFNFRLGSAPVGSPIQSTSAKEQKKTHIPTNPKPSKVDRHLCHNHLPQNTWPD